MTEKEFCFACMEKHEIRIVEIVEDEIYKGVNVSFIAQYKYCKDADMYTETEEMFEKNMKSFKEAYDSRIIIL